jgi:hypothetical protein
MFGPTEKNPPIQAVIETGVVPRFVEFLQLNDNSVRKEKIFLQRRRNIMLAGTTI